MKIWPIIFTVIALVLVIEGFLPFLSPVFWRRMLARLSQASDRTVRTAGFISLVLGAIIMVLVHSGILY